VEADRIDRLILHHGVRVVRAHAEVDLEGGCLSSLLRMYRVGLVAGVDRGRAADGASRDAQAGRQSGFGTPRGRLWRVERDRRHRLAELQLRALDIRGDRPGVAGSLGIEGVPLIPPCVPDLGHGYHQEGQGNGPHDVRLRPYSLTTPVNLHVLAHGLLVY